MAEAPEDDVPFEVRSLAHLASMEIGEWVVDRRRRHPRDIVADAILADRLTRQNPDIRRAALEEAETHLRFLAGAMHDKAEAIAAKAGGMDEATCAERDASVMASDFEKAADAIRALSDMGGEHG